MRRIRKVFFFLSALTILLIGNPILGRAQELSNNSRTAVGLDTAEELCLVSEQMWGGWKGPLRQRSARLTCGENAEILVIEPFKIVNGVFVSLEKRLRRWADQNPNRILRKLTVLGHGWPGMIQLGELISADDIALRFGALSPFMGADAEVDVRSCRVARSCEGRLFMASLAETLLPKGGRVMAGEGFAFSSPGLTKTRYLRPIQVEYSGDEMDDLVWLSGEESARSFEEVCGEEFERAATAYSELFDHPGIQNEISKEVAVSPRDAIYLNSVGALMGPTLGMLRDNAFSTFEKITRLRDLYSTKAGLHFEGTEGDKIFSILQYLSRAFLESYVPNKRIIWTP